MVLRTYWCELTKKRTTAVRVRTVFSQVDQFTCELDPNLSHTIRAAFLNGSGSTRGAMPTQPSTG